MFRGKNSLSKGVRKEPLGGRVHKFHIVVHECVNKKRILMQRISVSKNNKCMSLGLPYNQVPLYERFTKGSLRDAGLCTMMF